MRVLRDDVTVEGLRITGARFGIVVSGVHRARIVGNNVVGSGVKDFGLRGDAIRFWEVRDAVIEGNHVEHSRDIVVWYSPGNRIEGNLVDLRSTIRYLCITRKLRNKLNTYGVGQYVREWKL